MATLQLDNPETSSVIYDRQQTAVSVRKNWTDDWSTVKYLEALTYTRGAAPTVPQATFRWRSGSIKWEDSRSFVSFNDRDYRGWYVKIELLGEYDPAVLFVGRFADDEQTNVGPAIAKTRDQNLTAFGMAHELDRQHVFGSWVTNDGSTAGQISVSLTFNERFVRGQTEIGNCSIQPITGTGERADKTARAFSDVRDAGFKAYPWRALDIAQYLLAFYAPLGQEWILAGQLDALASMEPSRFNPNGMSVWQALNEVIDRRRGVGFAVEIIGDTIYINVFTTVGTAVKFDQSSLPANANQFDVDLNIGHEIEPPSVRVDSCLTYDWIQVVGEPILSCFTVSFEDGTLAKGWTDEKQTAYLAGFGVGASQEKNDAERATDKFDHVYRKFIIPGMWGWLAGDGQLKKTGASKHNAHPVGSGDGKLVPGSPFQGTVRKWGHTLEKTLPLLKDQRDTAENLDAQPEYRECFALVYDEKLKTHRYADNSAILDDLPANVRTLDKEFGLIVSMTPNHLLALNHSTFAAANATAHQPKYDYEKIIATVAAREDAVLCVTVKAPGGQAAGRRVMVINAPDAELWHVVDGTVLDVEKGELKRQNGARVLRDDSPRLRQIAAVALAWCGQPHAVLTVTHKFIVPYQIGVFIKKATDVRGDRDINSVVTSVSVDLQKNTTQIQTNYGEMDFAAAGSRGYRSVK